MLALLERAMTRLILALFVMSVCFATTPITSLHHTNLAYMPCGHAAGAQPGAGLARWRHGLGLRQRHTPVTVSMVR